MGDTATPPAKRDVVREREALLAQLVKAGILDAQPFDAARWTVWRCGKSTRFTYQPVSDQWRDALGVRRGRALRNLVELSKALP